MEFDWYRIFWELDLLDCALGTYQMISGEISKNREGKGLKRSEGTILCKCIFHDPRGEHLANQMLQCCPTQVMGLSFSTLHL